jgi:hypothetical protein
VMIKGNECRFMWFLLGGMIELHEWKESDFDPSDIESWSDPNSATILGCSQRPFVNSSSFGFILIIPDILSIFQYLWMDKIALIVFDYHMHMSLRQNMLSWQGPSGWKRCYEQWKWSCERELSLSFHEQNRDGGQSESMTLLEGLMKGWRRNRPRKWVKARQGKRETVIRHVEGSMSVNVDTTIWSRGGQKNRHEQAEGLRDAVAKPKSFFRVPMR